MNLAGPGCQAPLIDWCPRVPLPHTSVCTLSRGCRTSRGSRIRRASSLDPPPYRMTVFPPGFDENPLWPGLARLVSFQFHFKAKIVIKTSTEAPGAPLGCSVFLLSCFPKPPRVPPSHNCPLIYLWGVCVKTVNIPRPPVPHITKGMAPLLFSQPRRRIKVS